MREGSSLKLISVDVWDTLLRRCCHPDVIKLHVGNHVIACLGREALPADCDALWLLHERQAVEREIGSRLRAAGGDDEYVFTEVFDKLLDRLSLPETCFIRKSRAEVVAELAEYELSVEKALTYPDNEIVDVLNSLPAVPRIFLSDFYMPASQLKDLLAFHGLMHLFDDGISSCDIGLNKRSGRLFSHVHQQYGIGPAEHFHIGDNDYSDVSKPRELGIEALHFQPPEAHNQREQREQAFGRRQALIKQAVNAGQLTTGGDEAVAYGRHCAPLFVAFVLHVIEQSVRDEVDELCFFTREGEFFIQIYQALIQARPALRPYPRAQVLCVSRVATFFPSLRNLTTEELMRLWNQYSCQSLSAFFSSLGLAAADLLAMAPEFGIAPDEVIVYPWLDERFCRFFADSRVRSWLEGEWQMRKAELSAYLSSVGLENRSGLKVGVVDIGWRGTIQDNLAYFYDKVEFHGYYLGLNKFLNAQPANAYKQAFGPNLNISPDNAALLDAVAPLEMLSNSPHGSVVGYRPGLVGTSSTLPVERLVDAAENVVFHEFTAAFQRGVLSSLPQWVELIKTQALAANELHADALRVWRNIIKQPPDCLAMAYFKLHHNESFGIGGFVQKAALPPLKDFFLAPFSAPSRANLRAFLANCGWIEGFLARRDVSSISKLLVRGLMFAMKLRQRLRK